MRFKETHEDQCVKARNATVEFLVGGHPGSKLGDRAPTLEGTEKGGLEVTFSEKVTLSVHCRRMGRVSYPKPNVPSMTHEV
jgi:hypothetical protein